MGWGRRQHPSSSTLGCTEQQWTRPRAEIAHRCPWFGWSKLTLVQPLVHTPCLPLQHPGQHRNVNGPFLNLGKLPSGSCSLHSQRLFRAYVNGPQRPESICQSWELNPGSQSTNHCWNQGSAFHLEQPAWTSHTGLPWGIPNRRWAARPLTYFLPSPIRQNMTLHAASAHFPLAHPALYIWEEQSQWQDPSTSAFTRASAP